MPCGEAVDTVLPLRAETACISQSKLHHGPILQDLLRVTAQVTELSLLEPDHTCHNTNHMTELPSLRYRTAGPKREHGFKVLAFHPACPGLNSFPCIKHALLSTSRVIPAPEALPNTQRSPTNTGNRQLTGISQQSAPEQGAAACSDEKAEPTQEARVCGQSWGCLRSARQLFS